MVTRYDRGVRAFGVADAGEGRPANAGRRKVNL